MHDGTLEDVAPADILLPMLFGVSYGFVGGTMISLLEFFDFGMGLLVICAMLVSVSLITSIASEVRTKGFRGIGSGIIEGLGLSLVLGIFSLMALGCFDELYSIAIWIMPSILLILSIAGGTSWEKHDGFKEGKGRLVWLGLVVLVYLMVRILTASFWVTLTVGAIAPLELITMISQRLFVPSMYTVAFTAIELGVLVGLAYSDLLDGLSERPDA